MITCQLHDSPISGSGTPTMNEQSLGTSVLRTAPVHKVWRRLFGERSWARRAGTFRQRELYGLIKRPNYCYGLLRAADTARFFGIPAITACEFGVATGNGLCNLADLAPQIQAETGVRIRVVGFDTGAGLPAPSGHKDHPELWSGGDFAMEDAGRLRGRLGNRAELILGDINDTILPFVETLSPTCPLGFVSMDVDLYSGTVAAFKGLHGAAELYLPAVSFYFDDVSFYFANEACGELCAIAEHNQAHPQRPLHPDRSVPGLRPEHYALWYRAMYVLHILDHPFRNYPREREGMSLQDHLQFMSFLR